MVELEDKEEIVITQAENDNSDSSDEDDLNIELDQPDLGKTFQFAKRQKLDTEAESDKENEQDKGEPDTTKLIDLSGVGNIEGKPVIDFDIDSLKEKPWLKKGENVSSYFNYGFTEDTWKVYQLEIKGKSADSLPPPPPPVAPRSSGPPPVIQSSVPPGPPPMMPVVRPFMGPPPGFPPPGLAPPPGMPPPGFTPGMPPPIAKTEVPDDSTPSVKNELL